jgi:hypothetical protein
VRLELLRLNLLPPLATAQLPLLPPLLQLLLLPLLLLPPPMLTRPEEAAVAAPPRAEAGEVPSVAALEVALSAEEADLMRLLARRLQRRLPLLLHRFHRHHLPRLLLLPRRHQQ